MNIAVIGDYGSPGYGDLVQRVKILNPEEKVLDLSRHIAGDWRRMREARFQDIDTSHKVVIGKDWDEHFDAKHDITEAQRLHKEILIERDGSFYPL